MATIADLKEEIQEKNVQAEKEVTDGEFQHPNVTYSDEMSETVDATVTDSNIITKDTVMEDTLDADHVKLPGEPKGEILCKSPELVQESWEETGQKKTDLQESEIEMQKKMTQEKQACPPKDGRDETYGLPVEVCQKDTGADVPVKIIESNHDNMLASQDIEPVEIAASSISSRECQETESVTTVESIKEEVQKSNVIEGILPIEDNGLKNGNIIDSDLEKEDNASDSTINLKGLVTTEQRENKSVLEEDVIVNTDDPSAIQHVERSKDNADKKEERDAYAVEADDETRKNQSVIPSTLEIKDNKVATPSEVIEIKVPQNCEIASNFQASMEDDQQKYVNDRNNTAVETQASDEQMLEESYATKDVKVKSDAECSDTEENALSEKSGSTEAVSDEYFKTSITTISLEKDLPDINTSYSEDNFPKVVASSQGKTTTGQELKSKEDFDILLVSESALGENFQVERTQDNSYTTINEKEKMDEALPSIETTKEKTCQLNEVSTLKNVEDHILENQTIDESRKSEPSVLSAIKNHEKEDDVHKEELVEDRDVHANLQRDDHEVEKLDRTSDTCKTVGDDSGAMHPENPHGEIKNGLFEPVKTETNDTSKDKAEVEEAEAACAKSENALSQDVANSSINEHHEEMIQDKNISIPGEDQISKSHKLGEEIGYVKDSQDPKIWKEDCEKEAQNYMQSDTVEEIMILRNERESLNQESLVSERDASSLPREDENEKGQTGASFNEACVDKENDSCEVCEEEGTMKNTEESVHGSQDIRVKDLIEDEATYASSNKLLDEIDASPSSTSDPLKETIDCEKEVESIHASRENLTNVIVTSKPYEESTAGEKEVETMHASSEQHSEEGTASSIINDESRKEIMEDEKDNLVHSDQSSKTEKVPEEIENEGLFTDDQISVTEHLVKVNPTNIEAVSQEADKKSPGINESAEELSNNTQEVVNSSDLKLASETSVEEVDVKCIHGDQENKVKDLVEEEEVTYASGNKLPDDIDASPSCTEKPLIETIDCEKEVEAIHASSKNLLAESLTTVIVTSKPFEDTAVGEKEVETMHAGSKQLPDESVASSIINDESHIEIVEGENDHLVHSDQSSKTEKVLEEIEDGLFTDDQIPGTEPLLKEVHPTNVEAESQEADIRSFGMDESAEEYTRDVVHSTDLKLDSETVDSDQTSKATPLVEAEYEENTVGLQSESTAPSSDLSGEQIYQSNKAPVYLMLDPTGEIEIEEGSADAELAIKEYHATTTSDSDVETKDTCEVETSSLEKKDDHEEREIDIQLKGTSDDVHNDAGGGPYAEEVHIKNTEDINLDGDTGFESVKEVDVECTHGDQEMVKDDLKEVKESDRATIEKSMYEEAFIAENAFHFSPEKHEEYQFTSAHKAQEEVREKELADYSSKQENIVDQKAHDMEGVGSENDPNSRTSTGNEVASRSVTYGEKKGDTEKQIESLNPKLGDLPVVQTLFMKSLDLDDQKKDEDVEDPKTSRVEEVTSIGDHSTVEDPNEDLENKNVQEILHEREEKETVQSSLDFFDKKEGKNLLGVKVPIKGDTEQPTGMESRESAERVGTGTITKEEFTEFSAVEGMSGSVIDKCEQNPKDIDITALMGEITGRCSQAVERDSLNKIDTTNMEGLKVQEFDIAREHSRMKSEKVELRKENGNNGNGVGNEDNSKMQEEPKEGNPTDEKIDMKVDEKIQNQKRDAQSAGMLHTDIVEEYSVTENLNCSEQNVNIVDSVKCKETKDAEEQYKNMVSVPAFLESANKETFEEKEKPEVALCAAIPSIEGGIIEKVKREAAVATAELFNTIPTTNTGTSNEKGQRINVLEGEEKKNSDDITITKDMIFEKGDCGLKKSPFMDQNETNGDKGDVVEIKMTHEQRLGPLVTPQSNSGILDCKKLNTAEEKDEGTSKNLSSLSTGEPTEGTICKDCGQEVPEDTSLVHNDDTDPNKTVKEDESSVLMASRPIITGLLQTEEKLPTPKEEDACTVDNYLPVSQFLLNLIHEEFPDVENIKADNLKQEDIVPKDYIKTEAITEEDNRDSMELPVSNSSLMLEEKKHDFFERAEDGNDKGMEELKKLGDSPNKLEIDKDTNDDNILLSESEESHEGELKILNDGAKEELIIVSESGIEENVSFTHPSYGTKVYEQNTLEEESAHDIGSCPAKNLDVQEVNSKDEEILKQESNNSKDKIESQLEHEMINEAAPENKASVVIQPEEIKEVEDSINNKGTLHNTQGTEQTKLSHSEIYVDDLQLRSMDNVEKIKDEVSEDQTTKIETLSHGEKISNKNMNAVEQKNPTEEIIIFVDQKEVQSNVETVDKAMEDEKAFSAIESAEVNFAESLVAREIVEKVLLEVKTLPMTELAEATDPECITTGKIVETKTDKKPTAVTDEECLITREIVEEVIEEDATSVIIKSGVKDEENLNGGEETAQSNQFQVAEVLGYVVVQAQKQGEIFENESEFVKGTEKEENAEMNIDIKERSSGDLKESYLSMGNQTDLQKRSMEDENQNAESYLERKETKDSTVKEEKNEEAKNENSGQNVIEESCHETAPLIEMKEGKHSPSNKKHGSILSGVRSKFKHSISSVKKAITCSSSVSHLIHEGN